MSAGNLATAGLTKAFGGVRAVDDATVEFHDGKINAVSQEYRVSSNGEAPLTWTIGAYFYADEIDGSIVSAIPAARIIVRSR